MSRTNSIRSLFRRLVSDSPGTSSIIRRGRKTLLREEGGNSLFAWPFLAAARKIKGRDRVNNALYESFHRPLKNLDENLGRSLASGLGAPKLFRQVDVLPAGRKMGSHKALIEHETHSATAPVSKLVRAIEPIAASLYVSNLLSKGTDKMASEHKAEDKNDLLKEAAVALDRAEKRDGAVKLAFRMVEQGKIPPFSNYDSFQEKIASLMDRNLEVVSEALDMDPSLADFGKIAEDGSGIGATDPATAFFHRLA